MRRTRTGLVAAFAAATAIAFLPAASAGLHSAVTPADCLRDQLGVRSNGTNGTAGTIHGAWVFTNRSDTSCSLDGYPVVQLYGPAGRPISTTTKDTLPPAPTSVTLAPGGSATFFSSYSDVPAGTGQCPTSAVVQITPPNADSSLFIPGRLQACGGVVNVSAVKAGVHHP